MPKNKGKGGKNRRRGKNENEAEKRELVFKDDGQEYAQVVKMLGNGRLQAYCFDGQMRLCHIRGKMRKKIWINAGDIILVGLRDYQDKKADVIQKYNADEARNLKRYAELPDNVKINEGGEDEDGGIEFGDMGDVEGLEDEKSDDDISESDEDSEETDEDESEEEDGSIAKKPSKFDKAPITSKRQHEQKRGGKREADNAAIDDI
jgi:translation initiation factor 1A